MKKTLLFIAFAICSLSIFAQDAVELYELQGTGEIELVDGTIITGEINYNAFNNSRVRIKTVEAEDFTKYKVDEVKRFVVSGIEYINKETTGSIGIEGGEFLTLISNNECEIKIYQLHVQSHGPYLAKYVDEISYYLELPGLDKLVGMTDLKLMPFHKKMPTYISDCPELCEKITKKEKGYKIGLLTTPNQKIDIITRIAEEYHQSKI